MYNRLHRLQRHPANAPLYMHPPAKLGSDGWSADTLLEDTVREAGRVPPTINAANTPSCRAATCGLGPASDGLLPAHK